MKTIFSLSFVPTPWGQLQSQVQLLYRKIIDDKRLDQWRGMECIDIISQIDFLKPEQAKQCMADLKKYLHGTNQSFISQLDQYEIFAKDSAGNPWLENQNTGVVNLFIIKNIYHSDFWRSGFTSVESSSFAADLHFDVKETPRIFATSANWLLFIKIILSALK